MHQVIGWWIYLFFNLILLDIPGGPEFQLSNINPQTSPPHTPGVAKSRDGKPWGCCWRVRVEVVNDAGSRQKCCIRNKYCKHVRIGKFILAFYVITSSVVACFCLNHLFLSFFDLILTVRLQVVFFFLCWLFSIRVSSSTHGPSTLLQGPTAKMPSCTVWGESCYVTFSIACS